MRIMDLKDDIPFTVYPVLSRFGKTVFQFVSILIFTRYLR